jgi:hypothetical protein
VPKKVNIEKFRKLAKGAMRCVWVAPGEGEKLMGDRGEGRYIEHASPDRVLRLLDEVETLRARVLELEASLSSRDKA